jgi:hypothetical protein
MRAQTLHMWSRSESSTSVENCVSYLYLYYAQSIDALLYLTRHLILGQYIPGITWEVKYHATENTMVLKSHIASEQALSVL